MVMLTDLLERKRALEEENARIQRDLGILRQIDELARQLDEPASEPEPAVRIPVGGDEQRQARRDAEDAEAGRAIIEHEHEQEAQRQDEERRDAERLEAAAAVPAERRRRSSGEVTRVLDALKHFRGTALQIDLVKKSGLNSGQVSAVCAQLEEDGQIRCLGKGGYQNKSKRWRLIDGDDDGTVARANGGHDLSPRVRKAIESDAKKRGRQAPTLEGRILSMLTIHPGWEVRQIGVELGIPASTVGRLIGKLVAEGEVVGEGKGFRRVMS